MRLEEKIISGGDYSNDRRTFVSLEASDSTDEKRYKWSDRSELVGFLEKNTYEPDEPWFEPNIFHAKKKHLV